MGRLVDCVDSGWRVREMLSYLTFGGSSWYSDLNIPNSPGPGTSLLRPRSSALLRPTAFTRTRTQSSDGRVGLG